MFGAARADQAAQVVHDHGIVSHGIEGKRQDLQGLGGHRLGKALGDVPAGRDQELDLADQAGRLQALEVLAHDQIHLA
jgi:hypothetical protein